MSVKVRVGGAVEVSLNLKELEMFRRCRLGNYVQLKSHWVPEVNKSILMEAVNYCRRHEIYFTFGEILDRYTLQLQPQFEGWQREDWQRIAEAGGDYFLGHHTLGEKGGSVYWPGAYCRGAMRMDPADDLIEARDLYMEQVKKQLALERSLGRHPLHSIDSSLLHRCQLAGGVDGAGLEMFPGDPLLITSAVRGASRAFERKGFDAHIAAAYYAGPSLDELWLKRWQTSLYYAFLSGADPVYSEYGHFGLRIASVWGEARAADSPFCRSLRRILRNFYDFTHSHPRPDEGPLTRMAILHGHLDGYSGLWNRAVWGQHEGDQWQAGDAEASWDLYDDFFKRSKWHNPFVSGRMDCSGNPPLGQLDILPVEAPEYILRRYSCLLFLGWNSMTEDVYDKLKGYVAGGGRLVAALGHLNTAVRRQDGLRIFRGGDLRDLFGVRVKGEGPVVRNSGIKIVADSLLKGYHFSNWTERSDPKYMDGDIRTAVLEIEDARVLAETTGVFADYQLAGREEKRYPILVEKKLGRGHAFLVTSPVYPASRGIRPFYRELLRVVNQGEQADIRLVGNDSLRYAVYREAGKHTVYILNTDPDIPQTADLYLPGGKRRLTIEPACLETVTD